ncbi:putative aldouronate transport system permease protein [Paenibacillus taihuensis]|uniref:Putative aldouronate transport system permease protein n=1 Tax=Paenibacillus taihuensis TaxID=1156355 RepID=A0A3D9R5J6_9BACL|nr:ABC transporter permease subunit [Paenibacillus taihuensis]REE69679.1 putative aldouronate transport system permease protein [Paenibacillus taihuensis]
MAELWRRVRRERQIWLLCIPMIAWVLTFSYYPMYGLFISFQNYVPGHSMFSHWIGFDNFVRFFNEPDCLQIIRNTLVISGLNLVIGFPAPIVLALLLNELRGRVFKRTIQSLSYIPYFISWVVVANILITLLGSDGVLNDILMKLGLIHEPIEFLMNGNYFWGILVTSNVWKDMGFSAIIYLSAIAGIDKELYEAGKVDGLGRFGLIRHITLPGIRSTAVLLLILAIGGILNAGFEQQLLIGNPLTQDHYEVIDTYVYRFGVQLGNYSYGTAVGLMKSVMGLVLVILANRLSKRYMQSSIF